MSPMISNSCNLKMSQNKLEMDLLKEKQKLQQIRKYIEKNYEYVGKILVKKFEKFTMIKKVKSQFTVQQLLKRERS